MTQGARAVLARPVDERDHSQGPATALVELVEYGDYECPYCRAAAPIARELRRLLGDQLRYVYRHFPLAAVHPRAPRAAEAAEAAGAQGKFWEMHAQLFDHQEALGDDDLVGHAATLGLDTGQFARDLAERTFAARIRADIAGGQASGVGETPTFYLDGVRYERLVQVRQLLGAIREAHPEVVVEEDDPAEQRPIPRVVRRQSQPRRL